MIPRGVVRTALTLTCLGTWAGAERGPSCLAAQTTSNPTEADLVTRDPDGARRAIDVLLARAVHAGGDSVGQVLADAERLAMAYAGVWGDSVPMRTVRWFRASEPSRRARKVLADSLRQAGNAAFGEGGLGRALEAWRISLTTATDIADTVGMVAVLANIGTGFYRDGQPDSARAYLTLAYRMGTAAADFRAAGTAAGALASVHKDLGEYRSASDLYREAASLHERVGDTRGLAADYNNMGLVAAAVGDTGRARGAYQKALALNRRYRRATAEAANLVNLANLADLQGSYAAASETYRNALAIYEREGDRPNAALVWQNLGRLDLRRGRYPEAAKKLPRALAIYEQTGPATAAVSVTIDLARALAGMGALQRALDALNRATQSARGAGLKAAEVGPLELAQAEMLARLNRVDEADRRLARAERILRVSGSPSAQADAQEERGLMELRNGRDRRALELLRLALDARELAGDVRATAATRLLVGFASGNVGDTIAARRQLESGKAAFARIGDPVGEAVAFGALGQLAADEGMVLAAESLYTAGLRRLRGRSAPSAAWWLHLGLGQSLRSRHAMVEAAAEMRAAIDALEHSAGAFALPQMRTAFMTDKMQPYVELVSLEQSLGEGDTAFDVSERMRAQELLDLLTRARVFSADDRTAAAEEQALRQRITDLNNRLTGAQPELAMYRGPALVGRDEAPVREALAAAEEQYAGVLERLRAGREASGVARPWVVSAADVKARLRPDEAFIEYLVSDTSSTAFVVTSDTLVALNLNVGRRVLANLVEFARGTMTDVSAEPELWRAPLRRLYQYLVLPIDRTGLLAGKRRLFIAPHAELHYLPFAALLAPGERSRFLVERFAITYTPSASVWLRLAERIDSVPSGGMLAFAPQSRSLPGAESEVRGVTRLYGNEAMGLFGPAASEGSFKRLASGYRVLHVATFAVLNKQNPLFSYVTFQPSHGEDGRLEVHEVFNLALHSRLVVLSACQTALGSGALGDVPPGDDWVGLVQAFLYSGSAKVLATAWPIADETTAGLMMGFYRRLRAGVPEDLALAAAQRAALANPATRPPRVWGAFMLTGGR